MRLGGPVLFACFAVACSSSTSSDSFEGHRFEDTSCEDGLSGTVSASPNISAITGVASYDYQVGGDLEGFRIELRDASGGSLGEVTARLQLIDWPTSEWTTEGAYARDGEVLASQVQRWRTLGPGRTQLEAIHEVGADRAYFWATFGEGFEAERVVMGVPATGDDENEPDAVRTVEGVFRRLVVYDAPDQASDAEVDAFAEDTGIARLTSSLAFDRMMLSANDEAWVNAANVEARLCAASDAETAEEERTRDVANKAVRSKAVECAPGPLERFGAVQKSLGYIGDGASIADEVAKGNKTLGRAIAGKVGTNLATAILQPIADKIVQRNKRPIVGGLSRVGTAIITGGDSAAANSAVVDFFAGGGDDGGSSGGGSRSSGGNTGGKSSGDPHLDTFDGLSYDFQGAGEFVLVESVVSDFAVQVRQEPTSGICGSVSINTAVAADVAGNRLAIYAGEERPWWNGEPVELLEGQALLEDGSLIWETGTDYVIEWPTGDAMFVRWSSTNLAIRFRLAPSSRANVRGLLGNFDDERNNDIALRDGTVIVQPVEWDALVSAYAQSWQISAAESLFDYEGGETVDTFIIDGFPSEPQDPGDLPDDVREAAESVCRDAGVAEGTPLVDCTLDVGCTGDESYTNAHADRPPGEPLVLADPIFLTDWTVEANPNRGQWNVAEDGRSVEQTRNGDPTFFVSPEDYFDVVIQGTWEVTGTSDDDFIGFVFGFQQPLSENGDSEDAYRTYVLSWKGTEQTFSGFLAEEGLTLGYVEGTVLDEDITSVFWPQESSAVFARIDTRYGADQGWDPRTPYEFVLVYGTNGITIEIDGQTIFDIAASELPTALLPGRFGFYNYSQPTVTYAGFSAVQ